MSNHFPVFTNEQKKCLKKVVVLTGAGMSAESGIRTFRDAGGLWEGYDVMEVASPEGFRNNPGLVHQFYSERRRQLLSSKPNPAHYFLAESEQDFDIRIITQNVEDLHERAGSSRVLHLHGELLKIQSLRDPAKIRQWTEDLSAQYRDEEGHAYRPFIVWFGEPVPMLEEAIEQCLEADIFVIIGTSLQVYIDYCRPDIPILYIDPHPGETNHFMNHHRISTIPYSAVSAIPLLKEKLFFFE